MYLETHLKPTWDWLLTVMDATEAQLRFGVSLTRSADPAHPEHPLNNAPSLSGANFTGLMNSAALSLTLQGGSSRNQRSGIPTTSNISTPQNSQRLTVGFTGVNDPPRSSREREGNLCLAFMRHNKKSNDRLSKKKKTNNNKCDNFCLEKKLNIRTYLACR